MNMKLLMIIAALLAGYATQQPQVWVPYPNPTTSEQKYANYVYLQQAAAILQSMSQPQQLNYPPPAGPLLVPGNQAPGTNFTEPGSPLTRSTCGFNPGVLRHDCEVQRATAPGCVQNGSNPNSLVCISEVA
jgi:hypothetical protein